MPVLGRQRDQMANAVIEAEKATTADEHRAAVVVFQVLRILTGFKNFGRRKRPYNQRLA